MKKNLLLLALCAYNFIYGQLPPTAQALYTETYNQDVVRGQYAVTNGATFSATADGNSFYLKWFPSGATPSVTPLMVTLHGSSGNVFNEFFNWHLKAQANGVGIIAIQWYRGAASVAPNDYFDDNTLYTYIDTALKRIKYPSNKAMYHGFSRGSARSFAIQYKDVQPGGKNYFCTIFSNSGKPDSLYPLYSSINSGTLHTFCAGKRWAMFCGGQDPDPSQSGCPAMNSAKTNWVQANGGTVGFFIQDPNAIHNGFCAVPAYMDSVLKFYLPCFNTTGIKEQTKNNLLKFFPNPTENELYFDNEIEISETITVYDCLGIIRKQERLEGIKAKLNVANLPKGIYFLELGSKKAKFLKN